jgi:hypothetical protein
LAPGGNPPGFSCHGRALAIRWRLRTIGPLTLSACISLQSVDPTSWIVWIGCSVGEKNCGSKLNIYQHLLKINAGYDQVIRSLAALRKHDVFHRSELARFSALSNETRGATNSYLLGTMETAECLLARRLSERGVRFVQCSHSYWDQNWTSINISFLLTLASIR